MALNHAGRATANARWSCIRCFTVNAVGAQFCSDCGLAPRAGRAVAMAPAPDTSRSRLLELVPFLLFAVVALALLGLQLIR